MQQTEYLNFENLKDCQGVWIDIKNLEQTDLWRETWPFHGDFENLHEVEGKE